MNSKWVITPISDVALVNPGMRGLPPISDPRSLVTFVPMAAVDDVTGVISRPETRAYNEVRRGYTPFCEGDVIFAKITPCMQNGKAAISAGLVNGVGFGSTEFHVLRPVGEVTPEWLWYFIRQQSFRDEAQKNFRGSAGQQRVPADFLANALIPLPPLAEQRRIVARIKSCMERIDEITRLRDEVSREAGAVFASSIHEMFTELATSQPIEKLGEVAEILGGQSLPEGTTADPGSDAVMLFKVADMNLPGNEVHASSARAYLTPPVRGRIVPPGAVILPKRGGAIATNKKRLLSRPALLDPNLMAVVPQDDRLRPAYLLAWFETYDLQQLTSGGVVPQLNKQDLAPLEIPVPTLATQDRFIGEIETMRVSSRALVTTYQEAVAETNQLAHAVLRKAFAGEL